MVAARLGPAHVSPGAQFLLQGADVIAVPADMLIEWTIADGDRGDAVADVTVFADGRLRLGPRFGGGETTWRTLSQGELRELRRFAFAEQAVMEIDGEALAREVQAAIAQRRQAARSPTAELSTAPQMDAGTTIVRAADGGRTHEVRYHDLFGDAQRCPEIKALQRLRAVEAKMLEIAQRHAAPGR